VCATYACDGVSAACGTGCNSDAGCAADSYCATNGTCVARKAIAAACGDADCKSPPCRECTSGNCADGVCCNTACDGTCDACTAALKTSGADGECGPQKEGATPVHGTCTADDPLTCKRDGKCSASGGCRLYYTAGQTCGASTCTGNSVTGFSCDGNGTCVDNQAGVECSPYKCTGGTCTSSCTSGDDCAADSWCNAGLCEKKRPNGQACPSKDACQNNICADGFCCNSPCTGQCEACDVKSAEGACTPVTDKPHGSRAACPAGDSACAAATCDGTTRATCAGFVGPSVSCGTASCADGKATSAGTCSNGSCQVPPPVPCGSYACGATACKTECAQNSDCATGNICDPTTKKCISGATCDGDHTTTDVSGAKTDCMPYKCESNGTCKPKCISIDDCVSPNACDPASGKCVPPPGGDAGDGGGCSMSSGADPANGSLAAFALLALAFVRRRREGARR
jgi:MYXO-CTERM domain-containing protein